METYILNICGLQRQLPVCPINENLSIAAFIMFGDVELTKLAAQELLKICPPHNILLTAEAKGIPLCYEMAAQSGGEYVVARKGIKLYMQNSVSVQVKSITTDRVQTLYLDGAKAEQLRGKRVLLVDDVISTGESLIAMEQLVESAGGIVCGKAAVLAEGDAADRTDITFLEKLPLIFT